MSRSATATRTLPFAKPEGRGVAWTAADVAREIFNDRVTLQWVKRNFTAGRDRLGWRTVVWWSRLALAWKDSHAVEGAA